VPSAAEAEYSNLVFSAIDDALGRRGDVARPPRTMAMLMSAECASAEVVADHGRRFAQSVMFSSCSPTAALAAGV
jgi:hypothetical protein